MTIWLFAGLTMMSLSTVLIAWKCETLDRRVKHLERAARVPVNWKDRLYR